MTMRLSRCGVFILTWMGLLLIYDVTGEAPELVPPYDLRRLSLFENTSIGDIVYRVRFKNVVGDMAIQLLPDSPEILDFQFSSSNMANVVLAAPLDREMKTEYLVRWQYRDLGQNIPWINKQTQVYVLDVNDNAPVFTQFPRDQKVLVDEDAEPGLELFQVSAEDPDENNGGRVIYKLDEKNAEYFHGETNIQNVFTVYLKKKFDYQEKAIHEVNITAQDGGGDVDYEPVFRTSILVYVEVMDVPNKPPVFVNQPYTVNVYENIPPGERIIAVEATDQDTGMPLPLEYSLTGARPRLQLINHFAIDKDTGAISILETFDREELLAANGRIEVDVTAAKLSATPSWRFNASTVVYIHVLDVNDNKPKFQSALYKGSILENSPYAIPVSIDYPKGGIYVYDYDELENGTFELEIEGLDNVFYLQPELVQNEATVLIRVKDPAKLDYENVSSFSFTIVARETKTLEGYSTKARVTVDLEDVNDNFPQFDEHLYNAAVNEAAAEGDFVLHVTAHDKDSGNGGIIYYYLLGSGAENFVMDEESGNITVSADANLDRETTPHYYLTVEARDDKGQGNRNSTQLYVDVVDANDNAPKFDSVLYEGFLVENDESPPQFRRRFFVRASDPDAPPNNKISYLLFPPHPNFTINYSSGEITATTAIDFELMDNSTTNKELMRHFLLEVVAVDHGSPMLNSTCLVMIYVEDFNDNAPVFTETSYESSVAEDALAGTSIAQVTAIDADPTPYNGHVQYRIIRGGGDRFTIDENGTISVSAFANLDPDVVYPRLTVHNLTVMAYDDGTPSLFSTATVNVIVKDINNKKPKFTHLVYAVNVTENADIGEQLIQVLAKDPDEDHNLIYRIYSFDEGRDEFNVLKPPSSYSSWFDIHPANGTLFVNDTVDREHVEIIRMTLQVADSNAMNGTSQTDTAQLFITVLDENDNIPEFLAPYTPENPFFLTSVRERIPVGTLLMTVRSIDRDKGNNGKVGFAIDDGSSEAANYVEIDSESGEIKVRSEIDYDCDGCQWINFTIVAYDYGKNRKNNTAPFYIEVIDTNDNSPEFLNLPVSEPVSVWENASLGTEVFKVMASDLDSGVYGDIGFFIDRHNTDAFNITDPVSGIVIVNGKLDREMEASYRLIIQAKDNYLDPFGEIREKSHFLDVVLLDVNDNAPQFRDVDLPFHIKESTVPGSLVGSVVAEDDDDPDTDNSAVVYYAVSGNGSELFSIPNKNNGEVRSNQSLTDKYGYYEIVVMAEDKGDPPLSTNITIAIEVLDENLNAPSFVTPRQGKNTLLRIHELAPINTELNGTYIYAVDKRDRGLNAEVRYRLRETDDSDDFKYFGIRYDEATGYGHLYLAKQLKPRDGRSGKKFYNFDVTAYDLGEENEPQKESHTPIRVYVVSRNANQSMFDREYDSEPITFLVQEHQGENNVLGVLPPARYEDPSVNKNSKICYYIAGGDPRKQFSLDKKGRDGLTFIQTEELDREKQDSYNIVIKATNCLEEPGGDMEYEPRDLTQLLVSVIVEDINDEPPVFTEPLYTSGITTNSKLNSLVSEQINAVDMDIPPNDIIVYSIVNGSFVDELNYAYTENRDPFTINAETGQVYLNHIPRPDAQGLWRFLVLAEDPDVSPGPHNATCEVWVYMLSPSQQVQLVLALTKDEFRSKEQRLRDILLNVTGRAVHIDEVTNYVSENGEVSDHYISVFVHFVNTYGEIVQVDEILRLFDDNEQYLVGMYREFQVYKIQAGVLPVEDNSAAILMRELKLALIIICIILPVILIILICVWCSEVNKYKRKLRAANAMAFGSSRDSELNRICVPNTNQYAYEGSNPIWMEQYDHVYQNNVAKEEDEDSNSQNSLDENIIDKSKQVPSSGRNISDLPDKQTNVSQRRNNLNKLHLKIDHEYEDPDKLSKRKLPTTDI